MHLFFKNLTGIAAVAVLGVISAPGPEPQARAQQAQSDQAPAQKKSVKDQGEYDLFTAVAKENDANKKLSLLNSWKEKYPNTDFKEERLQYYLQTYQKLGQLAKMIETAKEILALNPKDIQALYWIAFLTPSMNNNSADALDLGEKAANGLLAAERPATTKEEDWKKAKTDFDALAHKSLGWIAMQRKNNELAEQEFAKSLQINPSAGEVSYWLGTVILAQKKPERQSEALYDFARAAAYDGPGSLNPQGRQQVDAYLTKAYNTFHGQDPAGLGELKTMAKTQPLPPPNFKIKTRDEVAFEKEEELKKSNPQLALWLTLKKELTGPNGEQYFDASMKEHALPKLRGKLISAKPPVRSKELLLGLADPSTAEVTLKLDAPLSGKPVAGSEVEFEGVPVAYSKDPFMVTFDVEKAKISGLKVESVAPVRRPVGKKSGARKRG